MKVVASRRSEAEEGGDSMAVTVRGDVHGG